MSKKDKWFISSESTDFFQKKCVFYDFFSRYTTYYKVLNNIDMNRI